MADAKSYKWHFDPQGGTEDGPNDPMQQTFKKNPYASLVRESIQNSLDAPDDKTKPVRVEFTFKKLRARDFPGFFELKRHVAGCLDYYPKNRDAKNIYGPMLDYFSKIDTYGDMQYIQVSDYNTTGMDYSDGTNSAFYSFVRSGGVSSQKGDQSGGSFGFGKAAYFGISPIHAILISTMTRQGRCFFEGVAKLCTHTLAGDNKKYAAEGYFDCNGGKPVSRADDLPPRFKRSEPGTDFMIMGINAPKADDQNEIFVEMKEAVVRNFWFAIWARELEVKLGDEEINADNLMGVMKDIFPDEDDNSTWNTSCNPRPYLRAVAGQGSDKRCARVEKDMPTLGKMVMYAFKKKGAADKVVYMRAPKMYVFSKKTGTNYGFYALLHCEGIRGNRVLREMENSAHNEWSPANYKAAGNKNHEDGRKAKAELEEFIQYALEQMFPAGNTNILDIQGLEDYLYIPVEVDEGIDDYLNEALTGDAIGEQDEENNQPTTDTDPKAAEPEEPDNNEGQVITTGIATNPVWDRNGDKWGGHGKKKKRGKGGGGPTTGKPTGPISDSGDGPTSKVPTAINVRYRTFAKLSDGRMKHTLVIHTEEEITDGRIDLKIGGEQNDSKLNIASSSMGQASGSTITGLNLTEGRNSIDIVFEDNMKHAIKLVAYELK